MKIAILGAGNVGRALATASVTAGHQVTLSAAHGDSAARLAAEIGAAAAASNLDAVSRADAVVLAVPYAALDGILSEIGPSLEGKVVIDVTNPLTPDYSALAVESTSAAEQIQARLPNARVVKAFNTVFAARQAAPVVEGTAADGFVAADDADAKATVLDLVRSLGLRPIDAGPLAMARALEAMALLHITLQLRHGWPWQSAWKLIGPTA